MMPMTPVDIPDVEVLAETGLGYRVRVQGREIFIGRLQLFPVGCRRSSGIAELS
jgi:hypothetical protein